MEARHIEASNERLTCEAVGEVETEDGVLVIRRIHVRLILKAAAAHHETAQRVQGFFAVKCPVYRSLKPATEITTELMFEPA